MTITWQKDRWFLMALGMMVFACVFLLAYTGTTDAFMDTLSRLWEFALGAGVALGLAKARAVAAAKRAP